jgi:hypothetical protein
MPGSIDDMVAALDDRYGTPPLAEFILNDPYENFSTQTHGSQFTGSTARTAIVSL